MINYFTDLNNKHEGHKWLHLRVYCAYDSLRPEKDAPPARVSEQRLQSYTIRWCHNPSVFARANTPSNSHSANGYDRLSTTLNGLKTVNSALNGCLFHWPSLNVTTVNGGGKKRGWSSELKIWFSFVFPVKTLFK